MKKITEGLRAIWISDKLTIFVMAISVLIGGLLLVSALTSLSPGGIEANVGYGDIGGYRRGSWYYFIGFAILGLVIGLAHNVIAIWIHGEKGRGATIVFLTSGILVGIFAFATLVGLVGGGL